MLFLETGAHLSEEIIEHLKKAGEVWANGRAQEDDLTFCGDKNQIIRYKI